jgi:hypothetical protein
MLLIYWESRSEGVEAPIHNRFHLVHIIVRHIREALYVLVCLFHLRIQVKDLNVFTLERSARRARGGFFVRNDPV